MTTKTDSVDMSPQAIAARLEDVRALYKLCMSLVAAGRAAGLNDGVGKPPPSRARDVERDGG